MLRQAMHCNAMLAVVVLWMISDVPERQKRETGRESKQKACKNKNMLVTICRAGYYVGWREPALSSTACLLAFLYLSLTPSMEPATQMPQKHKQQLHSTSSKHRKLQQWQPASPALV